MLEIYDINLELLYVLENYKSVKINEIWGDKSEIQVILSLNAEVLEYVKENRLIKIDDKWFFIDTITVSTDSEIEEIAVIGYSLIYLLNRRINIVQKNYDTYAEDVIRDVIDINCISAENELRNLPNFVLGNENLFEEEISYQSDYINVFDIITEIAAIYEWDIRIDVDEVNKKFIINISNGIDKSNSSNYENPIEFSRTMENILTSEYCDSNATYKNACIVVDDAESPRLKQEVGEMTGINRYETYLNVKTERTYILKVDVKNRDTGKWETKEIELAYSEAYLKKVLQEKGKAQLAKCQRVINYYSTVNHILISDVNIGDIVTIIDEKVGVECDRRITEIETIYENSNKTVNYQFGTAVPNLSKRLKNNI